MRKSVSSCQYSGKTRFVQEGGLLETYEGTSSD